ncbi:biotin--[acetyl-CoA-carboxylase] ligase [Limnochorda pilosa]|uniref:Bifunctional ligase/repressor BirA n=1 Tax=Limnochorda pilosa TaxID=1555112 RepID=A0A0K2SNY9_LIMPI|nr:biotin--[acetyl-CoA-carboxylase] ligase [Limnochorda pilosa]BAS28853.1 biotin-(acetyl-CoA carboxylase) ligase [Limnochorda pilosa]
METVVLVLQSLKAARGGWVSGEALASSLGLSRNAVWKAVNALRRRGYAVAASPRRGYRLAAAPDQPLPEEVFPDPVPELVGLEPGSTFHLEYFPELPSTNDHLRRLGRQGAPEGTVVVAEQQTAGRGRRGREWASPPGLGLWLSVLLRPPLPARDAPLLALMAAAAVRAAAEQVAAVDARVKWPNDVMVPQGKVCGVLAELDAELDRIRACILGVGLNVNQTASDFPPHLAGKAASLRMAAGRPVHRAELLRWVLRHLGARYRQVLVEGFEPLLEEVRAFSATLGRPVTVEEADRTWPGLAEDLAPDGALLVRPASGGAPVAVYAADVSIRPA